jgi:uncharacterized membrane protein YfcA
MIIFELLSLTNHSNQILMTTTVLLSLIVIGIITGIAAGMLGIGGAIIMVPALVFIMGLSQHQAQGTSLAVMLPPIGVIAAYNYYKAGEVNLKFALILAGAFLIGSFFGSKFALNIPQHTLKKIFAILLLVVSLKMLFSK